MSSSPRIVSNSQFNSASPQHRRWAASAARYRPPHQLLLTVKSTEAPLSVEYRRVLSTLDSQKLEVLADVSEHSYQLLASCRANAQLQDDDICSLLLRVTAFHRLWCQLHADADQGLCDINCMIGKIVLMTTLLAGGDSQHVLQTIEYVFTALLIHCLEAEDLHWSSKYNFGMAEQEALTFAVFIPFMHQMLQATSTCNRSACKLHS